MATNYMKRMAFLAGRIFVDVGRQTSSKSMKAHKLFLGKEPGKQYIDWYIPREEIYRLHTNLRYHGLFRDEHADFKEEMIRLRELRGKVKAKRGEGRRAQLKNES